MAKKVFWNLILVVLQIKQHGNSWKLRWANSTWIVYEKVSFIIYFLISWKLMEVKILTVSLQWLVSSTWSSWFTSDKEGTLTFCHWKNEGKSLRDMKYTLFLAIRPFTSPWEECSDYKYGAYMCFPRKSQICYILRKNTRSTYCNFQQILVKYYFSCSKY